MEDDVLSFLDDDADIPVVGGGTKRMITGGSFVAPQPPAAPSSGSQGTGKPAVPPLVISRPMPAPSPSPVPTKRPSGTSFDLAAQIEQDKEDILAAAARVGSHTDVPGTVALGSQLDTMLDAAIAQSGIMLATAELSTRYHAIARTFFRGLRDELETTSKLTMPVTSGGLGMSDADAEKVMATLGKKLSSFQGALAGEKEMEKQKFVAKQAVKHLEEQHERDKETRDQLDAKFQRLTGKDREEGARPSPMPVGRPMDIRVTSLDEERPKDLPSMEDILLSSSSAGSSSASPSVSASSAPQPSSEIAPPPPSAPAPKLPPPVVPKPTPAMVTPPLDHPLPNPDQPKVAPPPPDLPIVHEGSVASLAKGPASAVPVSTMSPRPSASASSSVSSVIASARPEPVEGEATQSRPFGTDRSGLPQKAEYGLPRNDKPPAPLQTPPRQAPQIPPSAGSRPVVADVKQPQGATLMGPIQELQSFSLVDFRRLSRDPRERTLKIKDKIDLLEDQSFGKKTEGISAWHLSPVNRLYLDMLRKSLEGKPVVDVIAEMEASGKDVLAKDEFDAIMDLNRTLRFG